MESNPSSERRSGRKTIALVAHPSERQNLLDWALKNRRFLTRHQVVANAAARALLKRELGLSVGKVHLNAHSDGDTLDQGDVGVDLMVFFWHTRGSGRGDQATLTLLRAAVLGDVPIACHKSTSSHIVCS